MPRSRNRKVNKKPKSRAHKENLRRASLNRIEQQFNDMVQAIEDLKAKQAAEDKAAQNE